MENNNFKSEDLLFFYNQIVQVAKGCHLNKVQIMDDIYFDINREELVNTKFQDDKNHTSVLKLDSDLVFSITDKIYQSLVVERLQLFINFELLNHDYDFNGASYCLMKASIQYHRPIYFTYQYLKDSLGLYPIEIRAFSFDDLNKGNAGFALQIDDNNLNIKDLLVLLCVFLNLDIEHISMNKYIKILLENFIPASNNLNN